MIWQPQEVLINIARQGSAAQQKLVLYEGMNSNNNLKLGRCVLR